MNRLNEKICRSVKSQGHRGHRKVKCKISQASVMSNLYVKFIVHSTYAKQVIVLKVGEQTDTPDDDNKHPPKFWLRPKKGIISF